MPRPPRLEFPGAVYHVIVRGNERRAIFRDDEDRERYLELSRYVVLNPVRAGMTATAGQGGSRVRSVNM